MKIPFLVRGFNHLQHHQLWEAPESPLHPDLFPGPCAMGLGRNTPEWVVGPSRKRGREDPLCSASQSTGCLVTSPFSEWGDTEFYWLLLRPRGDGCMLP